MNDMFKPFLNEFYNAAFGPVTLDTAAYAEAQGIDLELAKAHAGAMSLRSCSFDGGGYLYSAPNGDALRLHAPNNAGSGATLGRTYVRSKISCPCIHPRPQPEVRVVAFDLREESGVAKGYWPSMRLYCAARPQVMLP